MIEIKTPAQYWNRAGALGEAAPWAPYAGKNAVVIAGHTAWRSVSEGLLGRFYDDGIAFAYYPFEGRCTAQKIDVYADKTTAFGAEFVVGAGGGSALDLSKAVGQRLGLPVVTIPTVPATCAAWSALIVLYDDAGRFVGRRPLTRSPALVLADADLLAAAPLRYLSAGIADSVVLWYASRINVSYGKYGRIDGHIGWHTSLLALEILKREAVAVYREAQKDKTHPAFPDVIDAIFLLAGLVGSIGGNGKRAAFAHAIHDALTWFPETKGTLHGEKVAFGLIAQLALEGQFEEAAFWAGFYLQLELPVTLAELGFIGATSDLAARIAANVPFDADTAEGLAFPVSERLLAEAIVQADIIGRRAARLASSVPPAI
ncbi:iron-containing alcohol dehydrogenase family protein [Cohnella hashimotonis]|uniref:Iron-containing alcohol dehydrogenase family protein n=1 Tax=Cohnella hashimotonis TaxID=2826895 RepID=A0ABT6TEZ5_9BACL|nr:iron-containing alcohol dehydrogenase family protein [Cohnella hashimotonis]MDI4645260.1 iron-containing alcohol dehydrogenase family protein [Cohnella hashimotonis]